MPDLELTVTVLTLVDLGFVAQAFFQPAIENYEEISACDFVYFELGEAFLSVVPIVRQDRIRITPRDCFKR